MITSDNVILIEKNKKLREKHEQEVKKTSKNQIAELQKKLSKKDIQILQLLKLTKISTTEQISRVIYKDNNFSDKLTQKRMRKLFGYGCVDKFAPRKPIGEGSPQNHFTLSRPGAKIIQMNSFRPIAKLNQKWRHTVAVSEVFSILASKFKMQDWIAELKAAYNVDKELRVDAFAHWISNNKDNFSFIEVDLGTEDQKILNKKIDAYHEYFFKSSEYRSANWQPYENKKIIIPVIFVLNDIKRLERLKKYYENFKSKNNSKLKCIFFTFEKFKNI